MKSSNKSADRLETVRLDGLKVKQSRKKGLQVRPRRYRLMVMDENRMRPRFSVRASRAGLWTVGIISTVVIAVVGALLLGVTPLRSILPGYLKRRQRSEMLELSERFDSLNRQASVSRVYIDNIANVFSADVDIDSVRRATEEALTTTTLPIDSLLTTSEAEREFVRHYEQRERFNASVLSPVAAEGMIFYPPVNTTPLAESTDATGRITMQLPGSSPVSAIYRGTVVDAYYTPTQGYTVVIQHPNEFISRYSGLAVKMVERGQKVRTGERIGLSTPSATDDSKRLPVTVEMWYNGAQLNPKSYVSF